VSLQFLDKYDLGSDTINPLQVFHSALVKYGKEQNFVQVRQQIDMQNRSLLQSLIRGASINTIEQMEKLFDAIKTLHNIPLKPKPVQPIVETPELEMAPLVEAPKVEEEKEAKVDNNNTEEAKKETDITEQANPELVITADAEPENKDQENKVEPEKIEIHLNEDGDSIECKSDHKDVVEEVVNQPENNDETTPLVEVTEEKKEEPSFVAMDTEVVQPEDKKDDENDRQADNETPEQPNTTEPAQVTPENDQD